MLALSYRAADRCAGYLDFLRSRTLRLTMRARWLRPFFYHRALRLLSLFLLSTALMLPLSLFFPLWVLLVGPLVYGVPHLYSSLRYFDYAASGNRPRSRLAIGAAGAALVAVAAYRIFVSLNVLQLRMPQLSEWKGSTYLELGALLLTFLAGLAIYRKDSREACLGLVLLAPLVAAFTLNALWTIGALVLIHNFVAFAFWIRSSRTARERGVAWLALAVTLAVSVAILGGALDWVFRLRAPALALDFANLTVADTGKLIAPWSGERVLWLRLAVAFAYGQAMHYFVWLKAIPDQYHHSEVPTSFRQSLGLLRVDFGMVTALFVVASSVGAIIIWSFMTLQMARLVYFCLAAYHGYLEVAALALSVGRDGHGSGLWKSDRDSKSSANAYS